MNEKPKKKDLLKMPVRDWNKTDREYSKVLIVPAGTIHDSGFMHIAVIGVYSEEGKDEYEICGFPDDISCFFPTVLVANKYPHALVRMDCWYPQGVLQYHGRGTFKISEALSSQDITFTPSEIKG